MTTRRARWDAGSVRGLRRHLALTQGELAAELGVRQQTVSEWETGAYRPRGASDRVLTIIADRAGFPHEEERALPFERDEWPGGVSGEEGGPPEPHTGGRATE